MRGDLGGFFLLIYFLFILVFTSCKKGSAPKEIIGVKEYPSHIGEITYDAEVDSSFNLCDRSVSTVGTHQGDYFTLRDTI